MTPFGWITLGKEKGRPYKNCHHLTCFQSRRPRENESVPRQRRRCKPTSMMTSRIMSVAAVEMMFTVLFVMLGVPQKPSSEIHEERTYG